MTGFVRSDSISELPDGYTIYRDGTVTSSKSGMERPLSAHIARTGYPSVGLKRNGRTVVYTVHRLLALCFLPNPEGKPQVNHIDGDKQNNSLDNLEWCTDADNKRHAYFVGLMPRSTPRKHAARLVLADKMIAARRRFSDDEVAAIKSARMSGETFRSIGDRYGCSHTTISSLCSGRSYYRKVR
jgi:hypothetical protein